MCAFAPYDVENIAVEGWDVVVNKPKVGAYRAPGAPAAEFGVEAVIDEIAERLELDPLELRLKNAAVEGTRRADGPVFGVIGNVETLEAIQSSDHYRSELSGEHRGRGVAMGFWFQRRPRVQRVRGNVNLDGTVSLVLGSVDIGGQRAALAMIHAETLGIAAAGRTPCRRRHRLDRLHQQHRRQPHHLRHRLGRPRGGAGRPPPARGARRADLGGRPRAGRLTATTPSSAARPTTPATSAPSPSRSSPASSAGPAA